MQFSIIYSVDMPGGTDGDLAPGRHCTDDEFVVWLSGSVEKLGDELVAPTVSIPLITVLALF